jgi:hypothetical protein
VTRITVQHVLLLALFEFDALAGNWGGAELDVLGMRRGAPASGDASRGDGSSYPD